MSDQQPGVAPGGTPPGSTPSPNLNAPGPTPAGVPGATTAATGGVAAATPPAVDLPPTTAPPPGGGDDTTRASSAGARASATSGRRSRRGDEPASLGEVIDYVKAYAKQETTGPLQGAGRWIGLGAAGAITLGIGLLLLLLGLLRVLQTEWEFVDDSSWSWLPYLIVLIVCAALIGLTVSRINKTYLDKEDKR